MLLFHFYTCILISFSFFTAYTCETFFLSFPLSFIISFYSYMYHQYRRLKVFWPLHCIIYCVKTLRLIVVLHVTIKGSYIHCLLVCLLLNVPLEIISPTWRRRHFWVCFNSYTIIITIWPSAYFIKYAFMYMYI